jgi:PEP-CTERM motif-containing protein
MNNKKISAALVGLIMAVSFNAHAGLITLDSTNANWYNSLGIRTPFGQNYIIGNNGSISYNNFSVFDLSGISNNITSATLNFYNPSNGYTSDDLNETFSLFDVNTAIISLIGGSGGVSAYTDLGTGVLYGSIIVDGTVANSIVSVNLNASGLLALNNSNGLFAFGGSLVTADDNNDRLFGYSRNQPVQLKIETLSIPEPSTLTIFALGVMGLVSRKVKKQ